jgi:hypothetical protein
MIGQRMFLRPPVVAFLEALKAFDLVGRKHIKVVAENNAARVVNQVAMRTEVVEPAILDHTEDKALITGVDIGKRRPPFLSQPTESHPDIPIDAVPGAVAQVPDQVLVGSGQTAGQYRLDTGRPLWRLGSLRRCQTWCSLSPVALPDRDADDFAAIELLPLSVIQ